MTITGHAILIGWIPIVLVMFAVFSHRRALVLSFVLGWLFVPQSGYAIQGFLDYTKITAINLGALIATFAFGAGEVARFRPRLVDLPMFIWCMCPAVSTLLNGHELYDAFSAILNHWIIWGIPYFVGRIWIRDLWDARECVLGLLYGALVYVPLCLYEIRMSPQLHNLVFGFHQHSFAQTYRGGGWRPMVFMQHGLMLGLWMSLGTLIGIWMVWTGSLRRVWGLPALPFVLVLGATAVLCKSTGALLLLVLGLAVVLFSRLCGARVAILGLALISPLVLCMRIAETSWESDAIQIVESLVSPERAESVAFRFENEDRIVAAASLKPWFGWSQFMGIESNTEEFERRRIIRDSLWMIALNGHGYVGLGALWAALIIPSALAVWRLGRYQRKRAFPAVAALVCTIPLLFALDCLLNAMLCPLYTVFIGAAGSLSSLPSNPSPVRREWLVRSNALNRTDRPKSPQVTAS